MTHLVAEATGTPERPVTLREITDDNRQAVSALGVRPDQEQFVTGVADSLAEAAATPEGRPWYRAVYAGDEPVGFVMLSWDVPSGLPGILGPYFLWRLLVDAQHQRQGIGGAALSQVIDLVRAAGGTVLMTSYHQGDGEPWPFYRRFGFKPTGDIADGEIVLKLDLADGPARDSGTGSTRRDS